MKFRFVACAALFFVQFSAQVFCGQNIFVNGDFSDGLSGYGFGDGTPESVGACLDDIGDGANSLTYRAVKGGWGGLNLSEVKLERSKTYTISFSAKCDKPAMLKLVAFANGASIFRLVLATYSVSDRWTPCSFTLDMSKYRVLDEWVPFRIERDGDEELSMSLANFQLRESGSQIDAPRELDVRIKIEPNDGKKNGRKMVFAPAEGSMIFSKKSSAPAKISFVNRTGAAKKTLVEWTVKDLFGKEFSSVKKTFSVPKGKSEFEFAVKVPDKNGVYTVDFCVDGNPAHMARLAVSPTVRAPRGKLPLDIGYCGVLTDGETAAPSLEEMAFLADSGISYIRTWDNGNPFNWRVIEPKQGQYDWTVADATYTLAKKCGVEILPVVGGMFFTYPDKAYWRQHRQADWLFAKSEIVPTIDSLERAGRHAIKPPIADWKRMVRAMAEHFKGKIRQYEIMNEPNIVWGDCKIYLPYLVSAYEILKEVDPENRVVGLCTTGDFGANPNGFVGTMLQLGAAKYFDAVSFHSYNAPYEDSRKRGDAVMEGFRTELARYGSKARLWNSELYYLNPKSSGGTDNAGGPIFDAGYLVRRYLVDIAANIEVSTPIPASFVSTEYPLDGQQFQRFAAGRPMRHKSFQKTAFVPSLKYVASAVFAKNLLETKYIGRVLLKDDWLCYKFADKRGGKAVGLFFALGCVAENTDSNYEAPKTRIVDSLDRAPFDISPLPDGVKIYDLYGNRLRGETATKLAVSPIPHYIKAPDISTLERVLSNLGAQEYK